MEIRTTYKFEYEKDGQTLHGISAGFLPEYATNTLETINVLYPSGDKDLKRLSDEKVASCFIFEDGDSQDNYEEVEKQERHKREIKDADNNEQ